MPASSARENAPVPRWCADEDCLSLRETLSSIFFAGVDAVRPDRAVRSQLRLEGDLLRVLDRDGRTVASVDLSKKRRVHVFGAGKGAAPMAKALADLLGDRIADGCVIVKYGHLLPENERPARIDILEAAHPVPDRSGLEATRELLRRAALLGEDDLALCVFTGGASALTPSLREGLTLEDMSATTDLLLRCGASIDRINTLRKHLSSFSGGQFAKALVPAETVCLLVSDVVGDDPEVIGSGPCVPDSSTFADCRRVVDELGIADDLPPAVARVLKLGLEGALPETPKPDDPHFRERVHTVLVATNGHAVEAALARAEALGFTPLRHPEPVTGTASVRARELVDRARALREGLAPGERPVCLVCGGETTVVVTNPEGRGGRNQEMALAAMDALNAEGPESGICGLFAGTDGQDGPTDAAGGFFFPAGRESRRSPVLERARSFLDSNTSYDFLELSGDHFFTGPTLTNVMDLGLVLVFPRGEESGKR